MFPEAQPLKVNVDKWDYMKLRRLCTVKKTFNQVKRQLAEWEKILANYATHKGLISRIDSSSGISTTTKQLVRNR